jgi:ribonuclease E
MAPPAAHGSPTELTHMAKKMLIDAAHPEETRVVVLDGNRVDDFDFETQTRRQLRGNIYLAKVTRVEPSLQAAFVEYGGNRHGFLAFSQIHPDYYQIPHADREALKAEFDAFAKEADEEDAAEGEDVEAQLEERRRRILTRRYKIQEVIRRRQIMLVQVVKEERGSKGAALTTYLSLAGRYCVLMPNTGSGGGISRKITQPTDRKRLKKIATELQVPSGMGLIVRTAGAKRTKTEIKRDYEYLMRAWETIRDLTLRSVAPALIYEESSLVKRAIRDLYDKDVEDIHVEGEAAYREAKDFVRMLMPSHAKKVHHYRDSAPIFTKTGVERQLESIYSPVVNLRSGGYIVINQTEALVAIDVNSGRATREKNIEQTALKTNLEAAEEAARQMRLRDLAGLVVIDFIDMEEAKNDRTVEKKMKDLLRFDRARVQMGKISPFGLLELSRQRRRTGVLESSSNICPHCGGAGRIRSVESSALRLLRTLDEECARKAGAALEVRAATDVALYVLNEKRESIAIIEEARGVRIRVSAAPHILQPDFEIVVTGEAVIDPESVDAEATPVRVGRGRGRPAPEPEPEFEEVVDDEAPEDVEEDDGEEREADAAEREGRDGDGSRRRRRRGRRGGKRRRDEEGGEEVAAQDAPRPAATKAQPSSADADRGGRRRRRRRGRGRFGVAFDSGEHLDLIASDPIMPATPTPLPEEEEAPAVEVEVEANEPTPVMAPPEPVMVEAAPASADPTPPATVLEQEPDYEPDAEKRERFFAKRAWWTKKGP